MQSNKEIQKIRQSPLQSQSQQQSQTQSQSQPQTPKRTSNPSKYPRSSPYSCTTPIPIPIIVAPQYNQSNQNNQNNNNNTDPPYSSLHPLSDHLHSHILITSNIDGLNALDPIVPPIGCLLSELPFFTIETQEKFVSLLNGMKTHLSKLNKINNSLSNMNESLGSLLFGLFENAWCVHFDEAPTGKTWDKVNKLEEINKEIAKLKEKIELKRLEIINKKNDKEKMPPPPPMGTRRRISNIKGKINSAKNNFGKSVRLKRNFNEVNRNVENQSNKKFLKAGSKSDQLFKSNKVERLSMASKDNNIPILDHGRRPSNLKLSFAKKINTIKTSNDSSFDSSNNSEMEIQSQANFQKNRRLSKIPVFNNRKAPAKNNWEVKHKKPFR